MIIKYNVRSLYDKLFYQAKAMLRGFNMANGTNYDFMAYGVSDWFTATLPDACGVVYSELYRIGKVPYEIMEESVVFSVDCSAERQRMFLPSAIKNVMLQYMLQQWVEQNKIPISMNLEAAVRELKSITLTTDRAVVRKNTF